MCHSVVGISWHTNTSTSDIMNCPEGTKGGLPNVWQGEDEPWCRSPSSHSPKELCEGEGSVKRGEGHHLGNMHSLTLLPLRRPVRLPVPAGRSCSFLSICGKQQSAAAQTGRTPLCQRIGPWSCGVVLGHLQ